jgi:hypothetical protein
MAICLLDLLNKAAEHVSQRSLEETVDLLWPTESHFTFPSFQATARHVLARLREWGGPESADEQPIKIRGRTFELPADGRTLLGDWKMPLGWNCASASLEIHDPLEERGTVLADFKTGPLQVVAWSGPTPSEGVIASVVRIEDAKELEERGNAVNGQIVFMPSDPRPFKKRLAELGVAAVVTSFCPEAHHLPKACGWIASWSDDPQGSGFIEGDTPLPAMVISPEQGVELEIQMERGPVKLKMVVDAHYIEGNLPVICGYIDAPLQEEVLAVAHAFTPGANDNVSGSAVVIESLRVLQDATRSGTLPPLRRGVRGLLVYPGCGLAGFGIQNPGILRRIHAGISWTGVGRYGEHAGPIFRHYAAPDANPTVADTLLSLLMEIWLPRALPHLQFRSEQPYAPYDNATCDPRLNVPCPAVVGRDRQRHTSEDKPDDLSAPALQAFTTISAAYLHFLGTASTPEATWLAQQTIRRFGQRIEDLGARYALRLQQEDIDKPLLLAEAFSHLMYLRAICEATVMSAKRFMAREDKAQGHLGLLKFLRHIRRLVELQKRRLRELADCKEGDLPARSSLGEWSEARPYRTFSGPPSYAQFAPADRGDLVVPTENAPLHAAIYWSEGKWTFADIVRRVNYEFDGDFAAELLAHFRFMASKGMIQWLEPGEPIPKRAKEDKAGHTDDDADPDAEAVNDNGTDASE